VARTRHEEPDDDGDEYDAETDYDPDDPETYPAGLYADDERAVVPCPHCRAEIDEEAEQCPKCGMFISKEDCARARGSPRCGSADGAGAVSRVIVGAGVIGRSRELMPQCAALEPRTQPAGSRASRERRLTGECSPPN